MGKLFLYTEQINKHRRLHAQTRTEQIGDRNEQWHPHGRVVSPLLVAGVAVGRAAHTRLPARALEAAGRAFGGHPRHRWAFGRDGRVLRAPRGVALVWAQRGRWFALPLPWLEVWRDRAVLRSALRRRGQCVL